MHNNPAVLPAEAISKIQMLVNALVHSDWKTLEGMGVCQRVPVQDLQRVLVEYGISLAEHPGSAWPACMEIYSTMDPDLWFVDLALWGPDGETDLTLQLSVARSAESVLSLTINDLRVL